MRNKSRLDAIDHAILLQLRGNARISNVELAAAVGLTPPPCLRRVRSLEDAGVITGYGARVDPAAYGRGMQVIVSIELSATDMRTVEEFEAAVASFDEVIEARRVFGVPDYFLTVAVADADEYAVFQIKQLSRLDAVKRIISHQTMKIIKAQ